VREVGRRHAARAILLELQSDLVTVVSKADSVVYDVIAVMVDVLAALTFLGIVGPC
jgi:hypothetical protein